MKYKLIKEYPGSPKLGTELIPKVDKENDNTNNYYWEGSWFNPKNFPEFWEEVVEKDYEIVDFHKGDNKIISIKRLSDDEIFTIGDKIFPNNKIHKFEIKDSILKIWHCDISFSTPIIEGPSGQPGNCSWIEDISNVQKIKQKLFTTEDGVDIFEGNNYYIVNKQSLIIPLNPVNPIANKTFIKNNSYYYFSTKEKAEEYIFMNKPVLSLNDVASIYISADKPIRDTTSFSAQNRRIQDLVKSKI